MEYAEVAVNAPGGHRQTFTYSVPTSLSVFEGSAVWVPFGPRVFQGIVVRLSDQSAVPDTREISGLISVDLLISVERVRLAVWIADHYIAPIFSAMALMLPPGFESMRVIKPKRLSFLTLSPDVELVNRTMLELKSSRAIKQLELLEYLEQSGNRTPIAQVRERFKRSRGVVRALLRKGLVLEEHVDTARNPLGGREFPLEFPFEFTADQQSVWQEIRNSLDRNAKDGTNVFLLHGVTGSGKTEIYLQALRETIRRGKRGICLVPEISLTPQITDRFMGRFPGRVALLHSKLSPGEQYDMWEGVRRGDYDVVIGPRSAIFAPQPDLGLIIVDEEHEWAYKQSEKTPRYHARDVARELASLTGATLVLGSATPSVETFFKARRSEYRLVELKERITPLGASPLPKVDVVNMRDELKAGNRSIFSRQLKSCLAGALQGREQSILFINRRGRATLIECMNCGFVPSCRRCSVALNYHSATKRLVCHHCRREYPTINVCPKCASRDIKYFGVGTETVEAECRKLFPSARVVRFDSDAVSRAKDYEAIVSGFRRHEADVLVGTQIVAKGLDFPLVSVVGVVNADIGLNMPDFRAAERTFDLLCQVAGRAGRGTFAGRAIVQTFDPSQYAIKFAAQHDYAGFYATEIAYRRSFNYPPFREMVRLIYSHTNDEKCKQEASRVAGMIDENIRVNGLIGLKMIGPATGYIARLRGKYQMQIVVLGHDLQDLLGSIRLPAGWVLDVDPVGMV